MVMNYGLFDTKLHMFHHYKRINSATSVVNTSPPKSYLIRDRSPSVSLVSSRYSTPSLLRKNDTPPSRSNSILETRKSLDSKKSASPKGASTSRSNSVPPRPFTRRNIKTIPHNYLTTVRKNSREIEYIHADTVFPSTTNEDIVIMNDNTDPNKKLNTKTPVPTPRPVYTEQNEIVESSEYEYLRFSLRITEDIIRNNLYNPKDMERVFNSHIEANRDRLDMKKMLEQIEQLKTEISIKKLLEESANADFPKGQINMLNHIINRHEITEDQMKQLTESELQYVITGILNSDQLDVCSLCMRENADCFKEDSERRQTNIDKINSFITNKPKPTEGKAPHESQIYTDYLDESEEVSSERESSDTFDEYHEDLKPEMRADKTKSSLNIEKSKERAALDEYYEELKPEIRADKTKSSLNIEKSMGRAAFDEYYEELNPAIRADKKKTSFNIEKSPDRESSVAFDEYYEERKPEIRADKTKSSLNIEKSKERAALDEYYEELKPEIRADKTKSSLNIEKSMGRAVFDEYYEELKPEVRADKKKSSSNIEKSPDRESSVAFDKYYEERKPEIRADKKKSSLNVEKSRNFANKTASEHGSVACVNESQYRELSRGEGASKIKTNREVPYKSVSNTLRKSIEKKLDEDDTKLEKDIKVKDATHKKEELSQLRESLKPPVNVESELQMHITNFGDSRNSGSSKVTKNDSDEMSPNLSFTTKNLVNIEPQLLEPVIKQNTDTQTILERYVIEKSSVILNSPRGSVDKKIQTTFRAEMGMVIPNGNKQTSSPTNSANTFVENISVAVTSQILDLYKPVPVKISPLKRPNEVSPCVNTRKAPTSSAYITNKEHVALDLSEGEVPPLIARSPQPSVVKLEQGGSKKNILKQLQKYETNNNSATPIRKSSITSYELSIFTEQCETYIPIFHRKKFFPDMSTQTSFTWIPPKETSLSDGEVKNYSSVKIGDRKTDVT